MIVHVITNYSCNYHCEYCYLGTLRNDPSVINIDNIKANLETLSAKYKIDNINVYGGELTLLPIDKLEQIINICKEYAETIFITNLSNPAIVDELVDRTGVKYTISVNEERPNNDTILQRVILMKNAPNSIIQVATPSLMKKSPAEVLSHLESYNIPFVGFTQYFPSEANSFKYNIENPNTQYGTFIKNILEEHMNGAYNFTLVNRMDLDDVFSGKYTPWMTESIFIMPTKDNLNKYACILFNRRGIERFHFLKDLDEFEQLAHFEYFEAHSNHGKCKYFGHCYAEHLRPWAENKDECPGLFKVLEWYKNEKQSREKDLR